MRVAKAVALSFLVAALGCADVPAVCTEKTLAKAAEVEAASERVYARPAVKAASEAAAAARSELEVQQNRLAIRRDYDKAGGLCAQADALAIAAAAAVTDARKRRVESDAIVAATKAALARTAATLEAGRALLDAVPQPELDARLRGILAANREGTAIAAAARSATEASGWQGDPAPLADSRAAAERADAEATATVLAIRRGATAKCKPREKHALFFGEHARAHDGFALVEAGAGETAAHGFITVIGRDERDACRTLYAKRADDALALPLTPEIALSTWRVPGIIPVRLLFAWSGRLAWFVGEPGRWAFDAGKVAGFQDCGSVTCGVPAVAAQHIDVTCTCVDPKNPDTLDLSRSVRFSWHGNGVLAER